MHNGSNDVFYSQCSGYGWTTDFDIRNRSKLHVLLSDIALQKLAIASGIYNATKKASFFPQHSGNEALKVVEHARHTSPLAMHSDDHAALHAVFRL